MSRLFLIFLILTPLMSPALGIGKGKSLKTVFQHAAHSIRQASIFADTQLKTLDECQKLFMPKNENVLSEFKSAVKNAVEKLPEGGEEIEMPEEYFKIFKDYKKAKKNEGKPIYNRHRLIVESMEMNRQKEGKHIAKYTDFIKALAKMPSVQIKLNLIMDTKKICEELDEDGYKHNAKEIKCQKLYENIYTLFRWTGIIKEDIVGLKESSAGSKRPAGPVIKIKQVLGLAEDLEEESEERREKPAQKWSPPLLTIHETPQEMAQAHRRRMQEKRRLKEAERRRVAEEPKKMAAEKKRIEEQRNMFKLSTTRRNDPLAHASGTDTADIVEGEEHISTSQGQVGHSAPAPILDSPAAAAAAEVLLLPNGLIDLSRNGTRGGVSSKSDDDSNDGDRRRNFNFK